MNAQNHGQVYSREPAGPKVEILGSRVERRDEVLTPLALQLLASLHRRFNARRLELLNARARASGCSSMTGALPDFLAATAAVRAADWRIAPVPAGPHRPARRDHRSGRSQDDHQRPECAGAGVHGGLRGLLLAHLGQHHPRPGESARRHPPHHQLRGSGHRQGLPARRAHRDAHRAAARLAPAREARAHQRRAGVRRAVRFRAVPRQQPRGAGAARHRARTSTCRRWRAISRRGCGTRCSSPPRRRSACRAARSRRRC